MKGGSSSGRKTATFWSYFRVSRSKSAGLTNNLTFRQTVFKFQWNKSKKQVSNPLTKSPERNSGWILCFRSLSAYHALSISYPFLLITLLIFRQPYSDLTIFPVSGKFLLYSVFAQINQTAFLLSKNTLEVLRLICCIYYRNRFCLATTYITSDTYN